MDIRIASAHLAQQPYSLGAALRFHVQWQFARGTH
jgi:hypothetical protein